MNLHGAKIPRWLRKIFMSRLAFDAWDRNKDIRNPYEWTYWVSWDKPIKVSILDPCKEIKLTKTGEML